MLYILAYPTCGLSHCLAQDKQLELAHAVQYYTFLLHESIQKQGYNTPNVDVFGCVSSELDLRDLHVEDNDA